MGCRSRLRTERVVGDALAKESDRSGNRVLLRAPPEIRPQETVQILARRGATGCPPIYETCRGDRRQNGSRTFAAAWTRYFTSGSTAPFMNIRRQPHPGSRPAHTRIVAGPITASTARETACRSTTCGGHTIEGWWRSGGLLSKGEVGRGDETRGFQKGREPVAPAARARLRTNGGLRRMVRRRPAADDFVRCRDAGRNLRKRFARCMAFSSRSIRRSWKPRRLRRRCCAAIASGVQIRSAKRNSRRMACGAGRAPGSSRLCRLW